VPDFLLEEQYEGAVCGLDEVGRGPLAGPVVAACVYIPENMRRCSFIADIQDSKKLSEKKLAALYASITENFIWATAEQSPEEIDNINILQASLKAMALAMKEVVVNDGIIFDHALVDGNKLPELPCPATTVVKGDSKSVSIAAASIVAKVTRDRFMKDLHDLHPHYGWNTNVGYPTKVHLAGIEAHGITSHHRKSFGPVRKFLDFESTRNPLNSAA